MNDRRRKGNMRKKVQVHFDCSGRLREAFRIKKNREVFNLSVGRDILYMNERS